MFKITITSIKVEWMQMMILLLFIPHVYDGDIMMGHIAFYVWYFVDSKSICMVTMWLPFIALSTRKPNIT